MKQKYYTFDEFIYKTIKPLSKIFNSEAPLAEVCTLQSDMKKPASSDLEKAGFLNSI